ncbi:MAG TPA: monovalent cation/H+ antiporter complex subunit F [Thermoleophilaceae bacterium]|jgi:multicomponent Na+:H+ antiporter subunit F|nr:monovalent cation/H+ antiporter complex subunit F [Thermoleophilaceae bacterium]
MNEWLLAAIVLLVALVPCGLVTVFRSPMDGLVALELAGVIDTTILIVLSQGFQRQPFIDLALVAAVLSFVGSIAFARFMERWL